MNQKPDSKKPAEPLRERVREFERRAHQAARRPAERARQQFEQARAQARRRLARDAAKADIHLHTHYSDGASSPREVLDWVQHKTDLDVIAITDHDTLDGALEAKKLHETAGKSDTPYRFALITGCEVTSTAGHILALFIDRPVPMERPVRETIEAIHAQGGLAIAAHPMLQMKYIDPDMLTADGVGAEVLFSENFDAIEIINGGPTLGKENARARLLNRTVLFRAETGGSDAHILEAIGKSYTLFPGRTADDFRRSIEQKTSEPVSTRYKIRELFKYLRFAIKMKFREFGIKLFRRLGLIKPRRRRHNPREDQR